MHIFYDLGYALRRGIKFGTGIALCRLKIHLHDWPKFSTFLIAPSGLIHFCETYFIRPDFILKSILTLSPEFNSMVNRF